ncbi:restriction endonuclease [Streptomyces sp. NBC_00102]|uniref:restriction endonuclease n=1 Tax=Streptomyces sp. NBC_00102 TaxID=2975652 RepID=UPI0022557F5A|nr:restriction endonuclease [Streptomyces sp. NBC_00102]MCX5401321.1 restriction endonuclease [Streptomyces sp. NBC_00102]
MNGHTVLYDPEGHLGAHLPLDRTTHEHLLRTVLAWTDPTALRPDDYEQIGLLLTGAARAVAADLHEYASRLPDHDGRRLFTEIVLGEADGPLSRRSRTLTRVKTKAGVLRALYGRLDRLQDAAPAAEATPTASP